MKKTDLEIATQIGRNVADYIYKAAEEKAGFYTNEDQREQVLFLKDLEEICQVPRPHLAAVEATLEEVGKEEWKPDEDSYLCGYQQAVLNETGIIVSPNEGAGSYQRWLERLAEKTSPPTENHHAEKQLIAKLKAAKAQS